ncbi:unnamed protein product [Lymnaea stagnalis]|uniref:G-protein coupled receptors family 1 profile domain-containing protein n=1 Tax=Lymnaea stagnalis TaxID=6523 RepID=A0AAV2I1U8_LYMST
MNNSTIFNFFASRNMTSDDGGAEHKVVNVAVVVMLSIFSVVGVIGNALAFYIFFRRRATSTSVIFILALAGTDFITCLVTIPYTVVVELLNYNLVYDFACKAYMFLITSTVPFSAYIMVAIALDRYFCICHPFLHAFTIPRAKAVILCMGIPAIAFGIITGLSHGTYILDFPEQIAFSEPLPQADLDQLQSSRLDQDKQFILNENVTVDKVIRHYHMCVSNNFYFSDGFNEVYKRIHALNFLVAYVSVAILYILIYKSIFTRRANKARRKKNNLYPATGAKIKGQPPEETQMTVIQNADHSSPKLMNNQTRKDAKCARKITLTARNDPAAFVKPTGKITSGPPSVIPEVQEDERTNLLSGDDEAGNNESNENANNTSNTTTTTTDEPKYVYDADSKENPDVETTSPKKSNAEGSKLENEPMANGFLKSASNPSERQTVNENVPENTPGKLERLTNNNVVEDDGPSVGVFSNGTAPEEKPLLPQPVATLQQTPPAPPTSLSLKPNFGNVSSPQGDAKNSAVSKKYCLGKHVSTDAHTNSIKRKRPSTVRDRNLMANIKTAFMLFIVTLVFIIAFLPALLMANNLIPLNLIVFYGYFIYNVANPFIYAFMNQTFREDLKKIISVCRRSNDN